MYPQQPQPSGSNYYRMPEKQPKRLAFALCSFIFSLLPILLCCFNVYPAVTVFLLLVSVLALVLGIISLASHRDGKGFAIAGIIVSALMIVSLLFSLIFLSEPLKDMMKFSENAQEYIDDYEETGEVPEEFEKYGASKYDWVWHSMGMNSFSDFYGQFIGQYKEQNAWMLAPSESGSSNSVTTDSSDKRSEETTTRPANYGEDPITI
ncbi:hypothetical protein SAMN02910353_00557 [Ruminococcus sp. YRD2003]|uniref:DUF4190 domain-containing protein n=1 Tax=Ruminococcus sp. YRD2003 TaxID=1452313 RepID=UPI0008C61FA4|nr:hypothetical protein SAMN02910353_00557 [Ruminococcus flavefaciens]